jgi:hypothetical protein
MVRVGQETAYGTGCSASAELLRERSATARQLFAPLGLPVCTQAVTVPGTPAATPHNHCLKLSGCINLSPPPFRSFKFTATLRQYRPAAGSRGPGPDLAMADSP